MSNPLTDVLPPRARRVFYAVVFVVAVVLAAVQAADGDYLEAIAAVVAALGGATAASNTKAAP